MIERHGGECHRTSTCDLEISLSYATLSEVSETLRCFLLWKL